MTCLFLTVLGADGFFIGRWYGLLLFFFDVGWNRTQVFILGDCSAGDALLVRIENGNPAYRHLRLQHVFDCASLTDIQLRTGQLHSPDIPASQRMCRRPIRMCPRRSAISDNLSYVNKTAQHCANVEVRVSYLCRIAGFFAG